MIAPCLQTTGIENGVCQYSGVSSALVEILCSTETANYIHFWAKNTHYIKKKDLIKSYSELNFEQKCPRAHMSIPLPHKVELRGLKDRYGWNNILYGNDKLRSN